MSSFPLQKVRAAIIAVLWLALTTLSGCSMLRLGYGQAPDLAYWWLDGYVDFDDVQTPRVRAALADWLAWNRKTQLADYVALLARSEVEVLANTTPERVCEVAAEGRRYIDLAVDRLVPAAAALAPSLSAAQMQHLERRYAKSNEEFRADYLQNDPADRARASIKRTVERVEMLYGRVDEVQLAGIAKSVAQSPFDPALWMAERLRRQQDALQTLWRLRSERGGTELAQAALRAHVRLYERSPREAYRAYAIRLTDYNCAFAASLHNSMSAAQRQVAVQRLKGWETDLRLLAAENGK